MSVIDKCAYHMSKEKSIDDDDDEEIDIHTYNIAMQTTNTYICDISFCYKPPSAWKNIYLWWRIAILTLRGFMMRCYYFVLHHRH